VVAITGGLIGSMCGTTQTYYKDHWHANCLLI